MSALHAATTYVAIVLLFYYNSNVQTQWTVSLSTALRVENVGPRRTPVHKTVTSDSVNDGGQQRASIVLLNGMWDNSAVCLTDRLDLTVALCMCMHCPSRHIISDKVIGPYRLLPV